MSYTQLESGVVRRARPGAVRPLRQSYHAVESSRSSLGDAREEAEGSAGSVEGEEKAVAEAAKRRAAHDD